MAVNKQYARPDLIKAIVQFKSEHKGKLPEKEDWVNGEIKPSLRTFQRRASVEELLREADQYKSVMDFEEHLNETAQMIATKKQKRKSKGKSQVMGEEQSIPPKKKRIKSTAKKHSGFQCSFCGGWTTGLDEYYSSLKKIIIMRFIELLDSNNEESYCNAVLDCIHAVFNVPDPTVKLALEKTGYLEAFNKRFGSEGQDASYKLRCHFCGVLKDEWDVTVDTTTPICENICEECLSNRENINQGQSNSNLEV